VTELPPVMGPVFAEQVIPDGPEIAQAPAPVGIVPPFGGLTVAVSTYEDPKATTDKLGLTAMVGAPKLTKVVDEVETVPTEL
jgi:hypothetical protein